MRLSYVTGLICVIPVCVWLLIQFNSSPTYVEIMYMTWGSQLTLYLIQACALILFVPWVSRTNNWKRSLKISSGVLVCSFPFTVFVWLATELALVTIYAPYFLIFIFSVVLIVFIRMLEKLKTIDYIKQLIRVSVQIILISSIVLYRESLYQWMT